MNPLTKTLTFLALAVPATATAAPVELAPTSQQVSGDEISNPGGQHALSIEADGDASLLWGNSDNIRMSGRGSAGDFGQPFDFGSGGTVALPELATGADGQTAAVWRDASPQQVFVRLRPAGGSFSQSVQVSNELLQVPNVDPQVAALPGGRALVAWTGRNNGNQSIVRAREVNADGGVAGNPILTLSSPLYHFPDIATDASGNAIFTWVKEDGTLAVARYRRADGTLDAPVTVTLDPDGFAVAPSFDPQGRAFVMFRDGAEFRVRVRPAGDGQFFGPADVLDDVGNAAGSPTPVAFDSSGRATAAVGVFQAGKYTVRTATREPGDATAFTDLVAASAPTLGFSERLRLAVAPGGEAVAAWVEDKTREGFAIVRPAPGAAFTAPTVASPPGRDVREVRAAMSSGGRGLVSYSSRVGNGASRIDVRAVEAPPVGAGEVPPVGTGEVPPDPGAGPSRDTVAPTISGARVRRSAKKGAGVHFRLSEAATVKVTIERKVRRRGHSRLKRVGSVQRKLGSGSQRIALGRSARKPGAYKLTLRAADSAGNRSKAVALAFKVPRK
ncbi:MAG: hypothetical protein H0T15_06140 [Thermoleophilaceae bacterium]|nr:hypothetical protein [Thermoleophilaceae bacterium]